jgi:hypothetical protein
MPLKHIHFVATGSFLEVVKRLQTKLGLTSRTALLMYCVTRIADLEGITKDGILIKSKPGRQQEN